MIDWNFFLETDEPNSVPVAISPDSHKVYIPGQGSFCLYYNKDGTSQYTDYPALRQAPPVGRGLFKMNPELAGALCYLTPAGYFYPSIVRAAYSFFEDAPNYRQHLIGESPKSLFVWLDDDRLISEVYCGTCYDNKGARLIKSIAQIPPQIIVERLWPKICK